MKANKYAECSNPRKSYHGFKYFHIFGERNSLKLLLKKEKKGI